MKKSFCVYYCLYGDIKYTEILKLSVISLNQFVSKENIFVFSEYDIPELKYNCNLVLTKFPEGYAKPMGYRLILGKELLKNYDKVLHLDADTLVVDNIDCIFECFENEKISFATENPNYPDKITGQCWAGPLLNQEEHNTYNNVSSICCGVFGFDKSVSFILDKIYNFIAECEDTGFAEVCRDQHAFATYVLRNRLYNYNLQKYVCHTPAKDINIEKNFKIYHFAGGVIAGNKHQVMKNFLLDRMDIKNDKL